MSQLTLWQAIAVWILPVLFAITLHEVAHGWVAKKLGDPTAMMLGRLTINPIKHVDPVGTVLIPGVLLLMAKLAGGSPFLFGWAKPVPVTYENLRNPKRDMALVAAAGPLANLLMAIFWALSARAGIALYDTIQPVALFLVYSGVAGMFINAMLMVLNLLPLPPLDGGRILTSLLPGPLAWKVSRLEPYGFIILLALLITGILGRVLSPVLSWFLVGMSAVADMPLDLLQGVLYVLTN